jgi:hypothetical protein
MAVLRHRRRIIGFAAALATLALAVAIEEPAGDWLRNSPSDFLVEPAIPDDPAAKFGDATMTYFDDGKKVPTFFENYDYPTTDGGTYLPRLNSVDDAQDAFTISGEVTSGRTAETKDKRGETNPLPQFFTGTTMDTRAFEYGQYSVYARFPVQRDVNGNPIRQHKPVLILWPMDEAGDNWYHNVEVDFAEVFDPTRATVQLNVHWGAGESESPVIGTSYTISAADYHWYTVRWTPKAFHVYVDGSEILGRDGQPVVRPEAIPKGLHRMVFQADQAGIGNNIDKTPHATEPLIEIQAIAKRDYLG